MNSFSMRVSALLLAAGLICASARACEVEFTTEVESTTTEEPTVWYKEKSTQRIASAVAVAATAVYGLAVYMDKARSPKALLTAFAALFAAKKIQDKKEVNKDAGNGTDKGADQSNDTQSKESDSNNTLTQVASVFLSDAKVAVINAKDGMKSWWAGIKPLDKASEDAVLNSVVHSN